EGQEFLHDLLAIGGDSGERRGKALRAAGDHAVRTLLQLRPMLRGEIGAAEGSFLDRVEQSARPFRPADQSDARDAAARGCEFRPMLDEYLRRIGGAAFGERVNESRGQ